MDILFAFFKVLMRAIVAVAIGLPVLAVLLLAGVLGGESAKFFIALVVLFCIGWSLLPLVIASKPLGIVVSMAWVALAVVLGVREVIVPWIIATIWLAALVPKNSSDNLEDCINLPQKQDGNDRTG